MKDLCTETSEANPPKKTVGITAGAFDLLHTGHLLMLAEVKRSCDYLIVCLQTNPKLDRPHKNSPVETTYERYCRLAACKHVDEIIPYDTEKDLEVILHNTEYDFRFLSEEYQYQVFTGIHIKPEKTFFNSRTHSYSSSELRGRIVEKIKD